MCEGWVRAHLWEDRSRVDGRELRRRAVNRVVSGNQLDSAFPSAVLGFTFRLPIGPQVKGLCHRQETLWIRPVKKQ